MQLSETFATTIAALTAAQATTAAPYLEFLRVPAMSAGLYLLDAGAVDPQTPHAEDELYYVVSGRGHLRIGEHDYPAEAGAVLFVPAHIEHRFHTITAPLTVLVFFAPAETIA